MLVGGDPDTLFAYAVRFAVPINGVVQDVRIEIDLEQSSQDELLGSVVTPPGVPPVGFDRVDSIDPPLAPAPSP